MDYTDSPEGHNAMEEAERAAQDADSLPALVQALRDTFDPGGNLPEDCDDWAKSHLEIIDAIEVFAMPKSGTCYRCGPVELKVHNKRSICAKCGSYKVSRHGGSRSAQEPPKDLRAEAQRIAEMREHTSSASCKERIEALTYDIVELLAVSRSRAPQTPPMLKQLDYDESFRRLRAWVLSHLQGNGGCRVLSEGLLCACPLCDLDRVASPPAPEGEKP